MYNRYIPDETQYTPIGPRHEPRAASQLGGLLEKGTQPLQRLLNHLHPEKLDSGDILLLLIVLLLWKEHEDTDLLLALGAAMLLGSEEDT